MYIVPHIQPFKNFNLCPIYVQLSEGIQKIYDEGVGRIVDKEDINFLCFDRHSHDLARPIFL